MVFFDLANAARGELFCAFVPAPGRDRSIFSLEKHLPFH
jgi:hypothetical protein